MICERLSYEESTRFEDPTRLPLKIMINFMAFSAKMLVQVGIQSLQSLKASRTVPAVLSPPVGIPKTRESVKSCRTENERSARGQQRETRSQKTAFQPFERLVLMLSTFRWKV